jgi:hypothetical protein
MLDAIYKALASGGSSPIAASDIEATAALVDALVALRSTR